MNTTKNIPKQITGSLPQPEKRQAANFAHNIGVLRVPLHISSYEGAVRKYFEVSLPRVRQCTAYQRTPNSLPLKLFGYFGVDKRNGGAAEAVLQLREQRSACYFKAVLFVVVDF